ncbi:MAG: glutaminyl-peptide cyclotransferase [Exilibacterium sp.]
MKVTTSESGAKNRAVSVTNRLNTLLLFLPLWWSAASAADAPVYTYRILDTRAHNTSYFTQGLIADGNWIYESAGKYGHSRIVRYHKLTGQVDSEFKLPLQVFAEGLTKFRDHLYLLTWRAGLMLVFTPRELQPLHKVRYRGEGWGLTHDGERLIMSDGSEHLYFRDARDLSIRRTITVHDGKNEPADGKVVGVVDLKLLSQRSTKADPDNVLNGIAYDAEKRAFWITGKNWPKRYLVEFKATEKRKNLKLDKISAVTSQ